MTIGSFISQSFYKNAFSLVELVVAMFIFSLALIPLIDLFSKNTESIEMAREYVMATGFASELVDQVSCMPYSKIPVVNQTPIETNSEQELYLVENEPSTRLILGEIPEEFSVTLTILEVTENLKKICSEVTWHEDGVRSTSCQVLIDWKP